MQMSGTVGDRFEVIERHVRAGRVLDVGCLDWRSKSDSMSRRLQRKADLLYRRICRVNPDAVGVDLLEEGIDILRREGLDARCADAVTMDLGEQFDCIVAGDIIEHVDNVGLCLGNLARHLKPDGVLILTTPNPYWSAQIGRIWSEGSPRVNEDHTAWFDPITLRTALRRARLEPFAAYWVLPAGGLRKRWRALFREYFSRSFVMLARHAAPEAPGHD